MSRLDAIRPAERPRMHGRLLLSGPSGAGKTWTALSIATRLADGDERPVLVIDTERESALTYADAFSFRHLPWRPPFDPTELADTLRDVSDDYAVVVVDSLSHFWRGPGGTLDIADGKIGGWKTARPRQDALVQALLTVDAHLVACVRSKMEYLVEAGGRQVTKVGMGAIQDDTLIYEVNAALDIDMDHRVTVVKSRSQALPVGRMYPAGSEAKAAADYAEWLAGGVPPAGRDDIARIVALFDRVIDPDRRAAAKRGFVELFGSPQALTAPAVADAEAWVEAVVAADTPSPIAAMHTAAEAIAAAAEPGQP